MFRATATFLRTVVTRNTPFDKFLAGDNNALTPAQVRGAQLFFTPATNGAGGAGCFTCHSGPMLNKQSNDPDVTGIGSFIEENFINVGIGDHPIRALDALARGHIDPTKLGADGFPYHAEDTGREEVTHDPADAFRFRVIDLASAEELRELLPQCRPHQRPRCSGVLQRRRSHGPHRRSAGHADRPASRTLEGLDTRTVWVFPNSKSTISPTSWRMLCSTPPW